MKLDANTVYLFARFGLSEVDFQQAAAADNPSLGDVDIYLRLVIRPQIK